MTKLNVVQARSSPLAGLQPPLQQPFLKVVGIYRLLSPVVFTLILMFHMLSKFFFVLVLKQ